MTWTLGQNLTLQSLMGLIIASICAGFCLLWGYFFFDNTPSRKEMEQYWREHPEASRSFYAHLSPKARARVAESSRRYWAGKLEITNNSHKEGKN